MNKLSLAGALAAIPLALTAVFTPGAFADEVQATVQAAADKKVLTVGETAHVTYNLKKDDSTAGDTTKGCNASEATPVNITITTTNDLVASASSLRFENCNSGIQVDFTVTKPGQASITLSDPVGVKTTGADLVLTGAAPAPADTTAPTITASIDKSKNAAGWYGEAPTVSFTCTDETGGSGVASCTAPATLGNGENQTVTGTARDVAGNTRSITVSDLDVDLNDPTITSAIDQTKNANGWYSSSVTIDFTCSDALSGIASQGGCTGDTTLDEGEDQSATGTATDNAGHVKTLTVSDIDVDLTDPTILGGTDVDANAAGWFNTKPTVAFDCDDALSGIDTCTDDIEVGEGEDQSFTGTAVDRAGNDATDEVTDLDVDLTDPTITGDTDTDANANGWFNSPVSVTFTCDDALSGIASQGGCTGDTILDEGKDQSVTGTATDEAGNTATATVSDVDVDLTDPTITSSVDMTANGNGWFNAKPTVSFECGDELSGVDTCTDPVLIGEGANGSASGTAVDKAGNDSEATVSDLDVDLTDPTISGATDKAAAATGWYNKATGAPTVSFSCLDALSGVASCADSALIGEGSNQSATGTATDKADNIATTTVSGLKVDMTSPVIAYSNAPAATLDFGAAVAKPVCEATDATSGLASCDVSGGGASPGDHTWTITAVDNAGNTSTKSIDYKVKPHATKGFYSPVDKDVYNTVKAGSSVPLKFNVFGGATGNELTSTSVVKSFTANAVNCQTSVGSDEVEVTTTGGTSLRYDTTGKQFIQNWQTPKTAGACLKTNINLVDGSTISALFKLK